MISHLFIDRPRLAAMISLGILVTGLLALAAIPVARFPAITPPVVTVSATYPGADAETIADTVAAPIEAEVNGVDGMLYMESTSSASGRYSLSVTFATGTDPDIAQVDVQNRVQLALPRVPEAVSDQGVAVRKEQPGFLQAIHFFSPDASRDQLFIQNHVDLNVADALERIDGVSTAEILGGRFYAMRVWLDPDRMAARGLAPSDVVAAIEAQNLQASAGAVGAAPSDADQQRQFTVRARGRLETAEEFGDILLSVSRDGAAVRLKDVGRVELGAESYGVSAFRDGRPSVTMLLRQQPGSNALAVAEAVRERLDELSADFPEGLVHDVTYDNTRFVEQTIREAAKTLGLTLVLVVAITFLFLQDWRATLVPTLTIPVSLVGVFSVLLVLGYSANTIILFALILAIGLVVDDAIVVVENVTRLIEQGRRPRDAAMEAMRQVTGPIVATTLVLLAVFVPIVFLPGITGELYEQFAVTLSVSVLISSVMALTLAPALSALFLRPQKARRGPLRWIESLIGLMRAGYVRVVAMLVPRAWLAALAVAGAFAGAGALYATLPTSFLPPEDQGVFFVDVQLPDSAAQARTEDVVRAVEDRILATEGVEHTVAFAGYSFLDGAPLANAGLIVGVLRPFAERGEDRSVFAILDDLRPEFAAVPEADLFAFPPPAIRGLGQSGGFDYRLQAMRGQDATELDQALRGFLAAANERPEIGRAFSSYTADTPQLFVDLDRSKARFADVEVDAVFSTLQAYLGATFVNDFNLNDRVFQVRLQAEERFRDAPGDVTRLHVKNRQGAMVPLRTLASVERVVGPELVSRYNQFTSASVSGQAAPGVSSGDALAALEETSEEALPEGFGFSWSALSFQQDRQGGEAVFLFLLSLLFAYMALVGQYESLTIPISVILSVGFAVLGAVGALAWTGIGANIYTQIGLVLLVGLAAKNAILVVEFARLERERGLSIVDAAVSAARMRYRAVLMTALSFVLGVVPLLAATGAGAASRQAIGWAVFSGMTAATLVGIVFVPALYALFQSLRERTAARRRRRAA